MKEPDYSGIITWSIIAVVLGLIIFSIYVSYVNTSQYYQLETPEPEPEPPPAEDPPWLTGPSDQDTPWGQGPSD